MNTKYFTVYLTVALFAVCSCISAEMNMGPSHAIDTTHESDVAETPQQEEKKGMSTKKKVLLGALAAGAGYWGYRKLRKHRKNKKKQQQAHATAE